MPTAFPPILPIPGRNLAKVYDNALGVEWPSHVLPADTSRTFSALS